VRPIKLIVLLAVSLLLVAAVAAPASAEKIRRVDARGDAPQAIDIWSARYSHGVHRVSVVASLPDLGQRGRASLSISKFEIFEAGYVALIKKRPGAAPQVRLTFFNHFDLEPRECPGLTGSWASARVKLSVPRSCLDDHAQERVFAQFGIQRGSEIDRARAVRRLDRS
jgi:hypothetical protein